MSVGQPAAAALFEPGLVTILESLTLAGRRVPAGRAAGQWRARTSGASVEFADYRTYAPGDEFRRIDWNAYARLERLFVRLYRAEEDLSLTLVVDTSASMGWGTPSKGRLAAQVAGALAFIALQSGDRVNLATCRDGALGTRLANLRGQPATWPAWRTLERLDFAGATDLNGALSAAARHVHGGGLVVVLTDLFSPAGYQHGFDELLGHRQDIVLVHVLAPDELEPSADMIGEWRLLDSEPQAPLEATVTPGVLRAYRRLVKQFSAEAADFCRRRGVSYILLRSDADLADVLVRTFRHAGVLV